MMSKSTDMLQYLKLETAGLAWSLWKASEEKRFTDKAFLKIL